ncbi:hypothetical protein [Variovorax sp. GB1R11]|uniref:hypothetical protein n=1 Tax=Variovorax sp. GB1R11 TaxID=3443741 RepID=UPI003F498197
MCMNLLRTLAEAPPPCTVCEPASIDRLRVLQAAGLVEARIPWPGDEVRLQVQDAAAVTAITARGWKAVRSPVVDEALPPNWLGLGLKPPKDPELP